MSRVETKLNGVAGSSVWRRSTHDFGGANGPASPCDIQCTGAYACGDQITCGTAACSVECAGYQSCHRHTNCGSACACDVSCTGTMACAEQSVCPLVMTCEQGHGCTSAPAACDTCP